MDFSMSPKNFFTGFIDILKLPTDTVWQLQSSTTLIPTTA
jgi:hypothetical protein